MSLNDIARRDAATITQNDAEWAKAMTLHSPTGQNLSIKGLHTYHSLGFDAQKQKFANTPNGHINFTEQQLVDGSYTYKNSQGDVDLSNHKVSVHDSEGVLRTYDIEQWFPDKTVGLIMCILGEYAIQ